MLPDQVSPAGADAPSGFDAERDDATEPLAADDAATIAGPRNDKPADAIDVALGGTFTWDPTYASDDNAPPCTAGSGPDVFFEIDLSAPEVIYLDTLGSTADTAIVVHAGDCAGNGAAEACLDNSCGGMQVQGAWNLGAGRHCIVVDHTGPTDGAIGRLEVIRGARAGDPLIGAVGSVSGNTCNEDNSNSAGCGCEPARDHHYFFTVCPATAISATIETCTGATWDTVLQLRDNASTSLGCTDDSCSDLQSTLTRTVTGPGLFWAIIDGCDECGPYTLTYSFD